MGGSIEHVQSMMSLTHLIILYNHSLVRNLKKLQKGKTKQ